MTDVSFPTDRRLDDAELSDALCEAILNRPVNPNLPFQVPEFSNQLGFDHQPRLDFVRANGGDQDLNARVNELCWDWVRLGLLVPTSGGSNFQFEMTQRGEDVFRSKAEESAVLRQPEGLARWLTERVQGVDPVVVDHAREAHACFAAGLYQAAAVMLGVASEALITALAEALAAHTQSLELSSPPGPRTHAVAILKWLSESFSNREKEVRRILSAQPEAESKVADLTQRLAEANALRVTRNEAGHPSGFWAERDDVQSFIVTFPRLAQSATEVARALKLVPSQ